MANAKLAQKILDQVENQPHMHNQSWWFRKERSGEPVITLMPGEKVSCGTSLCVAGWAAHLSGYLLTSYEQSISVATLPFGPQRQVPDVARELLDLSELDCYVLFHHTCNEEAIAALQQVADGKEHIEWLDVFDNDEEYVEDVMREYYSDDRNYDYDYEN